MQTPSPATEICDDAMPTQPHSARIYIIYRYFIKEIITGMSIKGSCCSQEEDEKECGHRSLFFVTRDSRTEQKQTFFMHATTATKESAEKNKRKTHAPQVDSLVEQINCLVASNPPAVVLLCDGCFPGEDADDNDETHDELALVVLHRLRAAVLVLMRVLAF